MRPGGRARQAARPDRRRTPRQPRRRGSTTARSTAAPPKRAAGRHPRRRTTSPTRPRAAVAAWSCAAARRAGCSGHPLLAACCARRAPAAAARPACCSRRRRGCSLAALAALSSGCWRAPGTAAGRHGAAGLGEDEPDAGDRRRAAGLGGLRARRRRRPRTAPAAGPAPPASRTTRRRSRFKAALARRVPAGRREPRSSAQVADRRAARPRRVTRRPRGRRSTRPHRAALDLVGHRHPAAHPRPDRRGLRRGRWPTRSSTCRCTSRWSRTGDELFVPNLNLVEPDSVTLLETNQRFIEAYMVGLNHEFARELLWREYPTDQRGSYFRQFWDVRKKIAAGGRRRRRPARSSRTSRRSTSGRAASDLGDHDNREAGRAHEEELVLVIRGELLKKYPNTDHQRPAARSGSRRPTGTARQVARSVSSTTTSQPMYPLYEARVDARHLLLRLRPDRRGGARRRHASTTSRAGSSASRRCPATPRFGFDIAREPAADQRLERPELARRRPGARRRQVHHRGRHDPAADPGRADRQPTSGETRAVGVRPERAARCRGQRGRARLHRPADAGDHGGARLRAAASGRPEMTEFDRFEDRLPRGSAGTGRRPRRGGRSGGARQVGWSARVQQAQRRPAADGDDGQALAELQGELRVARAEAAEARGHLADAKAAAARALEEFGRLAHPVKGVEHLVDDVPIALFPLRLETRYKTVAHTDGTDHLQLLGPRLPRRHPGRRLPARISQRRARQPPHLLDHRWRAGSEPQALRAAWLALRAVPRRGSRAVAARPVRAGQRSRGAGRGGRRAPAGDPHRGGRAREPSSTTSAPTGPWSGRPAATEAEAPTTTSALGSAQARADEVVATLAPVNLYDVDVQPSGSVTPRVVLLPAARPRRPADVRRGLDPGRACLDAARTPGPDGLPWRSGRLRGRQPHPGRPAGRARPVRRRRTSSSAPTAPTSSSPRR